MNRCRWRLGPLLFCPLLSHMIVHLNVSPASLPEEKHRLHTAASEKPKHNSGWHLTVSILLAIVYAWGDLAARSVKLLSGMSLRGKLRTAWPLYISEMSSSRLTVSMFTFVLEHLCYLYIVFLHSSGLWMPWWVCLLVWLSTCFSLFMWLKTRNTLFD